MDASEICSLADEILNMTKTLELTGQPDLAEKEIEAFALLMEKRQPMVDKLTRLVQEKRNAAAKEDSESIDKIVSGILNLDKENLRVMEYIKESVTTSLKDVRSGKKVSNAYMHPMENLTGGLLDTKQ